MLAKVCLRSTYVAIETHVAQYGWTGNLRLPWQARAELQEYKNVCLLRNGHGFESQYMDVRVDRLLPNPLCKNPFLKGGETQFNSMAFSDASKVKAAVHYFDGTASRNLWFEFTKSEENESSGCRELLAIEKFLHHMKLDLAFTGKSILWGTDSTNIYILE